MPVLKEDSKAEWLTTKPIGSKHFVRICLIQWFYHHLSLVLEARAAKKIRTSLAMQRHEQVRKLHCQWRMWRKSVMMWDDVKGSGIGQVQTGDVDCFKPRRCLWSLHNYDRHTCSCRFAESPSVIYLTIWVWGWFTWSFIPFPRSWHSITETRAKVVAATATGPSEGA